METVKKDVKIIMPTIGGSKDKLLRVAAYCRVSTDSEDQMNSLVAQVKYYNDFIKKNSSMILVDIYADEGITGTSIYKREEFKRMIKDAKAGRIDKIYVKSVSRFARNSLECIENIRLLKSFGTSVMFENDGIDTETMNSEMILYIKSAFAQSESIAGSKRVTTAARMKMENGEFSICTVPYGFTVENNTLIPIPEYKPVIERIFREYLSGKGYGKIAEELNAEKIVDRIWNVAAIKYILNNERYVGDSLLQKTYTPQIFPLRNRRNYGQVDKYYVFNTHQPMIDRELFDAVKGKLEKQRMEAKTSQFNQNSVFSQKIKCGDCGYIYKRKMSSGNLYWVCSGNGIAGQRCDTHNIKDSELKKAFVRMFNRIKLFEDEIVGFAISQLTAIKSKVNSQNSTISDIDTEIFALCERNNILARLKAKDIIDDISFMEQTQEIQGRLAELRNRRIRLINDDAEEKCIERFRNLKAELDSYKDYMLCFDADVFDAIINEVIVFEKGYLEFELKCGLKLKESVLL